MPDSVRRNLLKAGLGVGVAAWTAGALGQSGSKSTASDFLNGGMKGFCVGGVQSHDQTHFRAFAETGANVGRILFPFRKSANGDRFDWSRSDAISLSRILNWARGRDIHFVVLGDFEGVDRPEFWRNMALRESFVESWGWFAKTFGNDSAIAGLDLLNEPNPPSRDGNLIEANASWRPLAESAIETIRTEGVFLPVIYEGVDGGGIMGLRDFQPLGDSQVVYSIHHYTPHEITHQGVDPRWPNAIPYPAGLEWQLGGWDRELGVTVYDRKRLEEDLRHTIAFQKRYRVPIYVGEFSCVRWAPNGSRDRYIADCLAIYKKFGWSWTYHEFRGWPGWDAEIASESHSIAARSSNAPAMKMLRSEIAGSTASD